MTPSISTATSRGSAATPIAARAGVGLVEALGHDLVDEREVGQIGEEDVQLDDLGERAAGGLADRLEIVEHLDDLRAHVLADELHRAGHERNGAGEIDGAAGLDGLRVGADGVRCLVGADGLTGHGGRVSRKGGKSQDRGDYTAALQRPSCAALVIRSGLRDRSAIRPRDPMDSLGRGRPELGDPHPVRPGLGHLVSCRAARSGRR